MHRRLKTHIRFLEKQDGVRYLDLRRVVNRALGGGGKKKPKKKKTGDGASSHASSPAASSAAAKRKAPAAAASGERKRKRTAAPAPRFQVGDWVRSCECPREKQRILEITDVYKDDEGPHTEYIYFQHDLQFSGRNLTLFRSAAEVAMLPKFEKNKSYYNIEDPDDNIKVLESKDGKVLIKLFFAPVGVLENQAAWRLPIQRDRNGEYVTFRQNWANAKVRKFHAKNQS